MMTNMPGESQNNKNSSRQICTTARSTLSIPVTANYADFSSDYLISTHVANKVKDKFYEEDIPALENVCPFAAAKRTLIDNEISNTVSHLCHDFSRALSIKFTEKLQANVLNRLVKVLLHAQALTGRHFEKLKSRAINVETVLGNVDPAKDQDLFIDYNIRTFSAPRDWDFEPCSIHYDNVCFVSRHNNFRLSDSYPAGHGYRACTENRSAEQTY